MRTSRTTNVIARTALFAGVGFTALGFGANVAGAETPAQDFQFQGEIVEPQPEPDPTPFPGPVVLDNGPVDPGPDPMPEEPEFPIAQPEPQPEPDPEIDDKAPVPQDDEDPTPLPDGPGELTDGGCNATHGCEPEPCNELLASCDLTDTPEGEDTPEDEDTPADDTPADDDTEVLDDSTENASGTLPRTGGGIALLAMVGGALTGVGVAIRKLAARS